MSISSVCLFCGSSFGNDPVFREAAETFGRSVAHRGWVLVYGGARIGLMGAAADAALAVGGRVVGVIPEALAGLEIPHVGLTELHIVPDMHTRKAKMASISDAFVALPGGYGTLDELCEILTWRQLAIHGNPIGLLNLNGFYDPLIQLFDSSTKAGFLKPLHRDIPLVGTTVDEVLELIATSVPPRTSPDLKWT